MLEHRCLATGYHVDHRGRSLVEFSEAPSTYECVYEYIHIYNVYVTYVYVYMFVHVMYVMHVM